MRLLDAAASVPGTKGIMLRLDYSDIDMEKLWRRIRPLMASRSHLRAAA
jgi:pyrimidine oxygenase